MKCRRRNGTSHLMSFGAELVIPWETPSQAGAVAGATQCRTPADKETHAVRHRAARSYPQNRKLNHTKSSQPEDAVLALWKEIAKSTPGMTRKNWQWAAARILARAKTPPRDPSAFLRKSWPRFLAAWDAEMAHWLEEEAFALLQQQESLADVADLLKFRAAEYDLPYSSESIDAALARASLRLERQRSLHAELRVGCR